MGWAWLVPSVCICRRWEPREISSRWLTPSTPTPTLSMIVRSWRNKQWLSQSGYDLSSRHLKWETVVRGQNYSTSLSSLPDSLQWRKLTTKGRELCWNRSGQDILQILNFIKQTLRWPTSIMSSTISLGKHWATVTAGQKLILFFSFYYEGSKHQPTQVDSIRSKILLLREDQVIRSSLEPVYGEFLKRKNLHPSLFLEQCILSLLWETF